MTKYIVVLDNLVDVGQRHLGSHVLCGESGFGLLWLPGTVDKPHQQVARFISDRYAKVACDKFGGSRIAPIECNLDPKGCIYARLPAR